jgi:protein-disulfide isomerase
MQKEISKPRIEVPARSRTLRVAVSLSALAGVVTVASCREGSATPKEKPAVVQQGSSSSDMPQVLATVGDEKITMADVRARSGDQLDQLETAYQLAKHKIVGSALDSILYDKTLGAEATKSGKSVDALVTAEAGPNGVEPSEADIAAWYQENQSRVGGRTLDQVRTQIADLLRTERKNAAERKLEERLRTERKVTVAYEPFRVQLNNDKAPTLGKSDAPITLVEFSDFQCPYCQATVPTLKQVEKKYGDKVQIVYRQFPLSIHPFAPKAAEASLCANEYGKFWEMHDAMFSDQKKLSVSDLKETARRVGIDGKKFDSCLDAGRYVEQVQNDQKEGLRLGVNGTPAMYINGRAVDGGAVPFTKLEALIETELARAKPKS